MEENKEFNQLKYIQEWQKKNYINFKVQFRKEYNDKLMKILEKKKITKADFLRNAIDEEYKKLKDQ